MQKKSTTDQSAEARQRSIKKLRITLAVTITLYVISLFLPLISPFTRFPLYIVMCGHRPIAASDFASGYTYTIPGDRDYGIDIFTDHYFCNEEEAYAAGYHKLN